MAMNTGDWWDDPTYDEIAAVDTGDETDTERGPTPADGARNAIKLLVHLMMKGILTAKQMCILCYWMFIAGCGSPVDNVAKGPGDANASNYDRACDSAMGFRSLMTQYAKIRVPGFAAHSSARISMDMSVMPAHESLNDELLENPELHTVLRESISNRSLPTSYFAHPHVRAASEGHEPFPLAIYFDAMPYIKRDGVLAIVVVNLLSGVRHPVGVLRKRTF